MGDEKQGTTFALLVGRERPTRLVLSTVVPRKSDGRMDMREIGLEFNVKSESEPTLTSSIESWSTLIAMKSGSTMIIENSPVGSSKSNGIVERTIQPVQGVIRTIREAIEEKWDVKVDVAHSVSPWIAEQAGFLTTRFEVGRDGKTAYERLKENQQKIQGMWFADGTVWKKVTWECGVYFVIKATMGEVIVANQNGVWPARTVRRKMARERWERSNLEMIVGVPWQTTQKWTENVSKERS